MSVPAEKRKPALHNKSCNPQIVGRNRRAFNPQLPEESSVVVGRIDRWKQNIYPGAVKKMFKDMLILPAPGTQEKTCPEFSNHDKRYVYFLTDTKKMDNLGNAICKITVTIGVDRDFYRHRSGSTVS